MPKLESYSHDLAYSYAPGLFPAMECIRNIPDRCTRLLVSSRLRSSPDVEALLALADQHAVRTETADRVLERLSKKENCFAAMVYQKAESVFMPDVPHVVLHETSDTGNMGTILRTALGLGFFNIAIIRPAVDSDDPRTVRASMGALFSLNIRHFDAFRDYRREFPDQNLYPFMLDGSASLEEVQENIHCPYALVFGNEARGLPSDFSQVGQAVRIPHSSRIDSLNLAVAAGIGMYAFSHRKDGLTP